MKVFDARSLIVPRGKIENYLLNSDHPLGSGKAKFFVHFGFHRENWENLAEALKNHAQLNPVAEAIEDADGITYVVEGKLQTPSGREPQLRSVWLLETGELAPRFITAYPLDV